MYLYLCASIFYCVRVCVCLQAIPIAIPSLLPSSLVPCRILLLPRWKI